jgi:hypothetical protein
MSSDYAQAIAASFQGRPIVSQRAGRHYAEHHCFAYRSIHSRRLKTLGTSTYRGRHDVSKLPRTAFQPGCAPGPGRPKGQRNRLTEIALQALGDDFALHGKETIEKVRRERPHHYLSIVASLLPRQVSIEKLSPFSDISDEELQLLEEYLVAVRARTVRELEINGAAIELEPSDATQQGS